MIRHVICDEIFSEAPGKSIREQIEENSHKVVLVKSSKNSKYAAKDRNKKKSEK